MKNSSIQLFDSLTIDGLSWPETEDGNYARKYLIPLIKNGPNHYIDNVKTHMLALKIDDIVLPVTINHTEYLNSYVCSIYSHFINCPKELLNRLRNRFLGSLGGFFFDVFGIALRWGKIDKVVAVNNWLLPTNLYPELNQDHIKAIKDYLLTLYPDHAIVFYSINPDTHPSLHQWLKKEDFDFIAKRRVFLLDTTKESVFAARMFKSDLKLYEKNTYTWLDHAEIKSEEAHRILELYYALYHEKYSHLNPMINHRYILLALQEKLLSFHALKKEDTIFAVMGHYSRQGIMTSPFFGYDQRLPQEEGLYRLLSTRLSLKAKETKVMLNQSAGAASYKKLRRAKPSTEYLAVFRRHLPLKRRIVWKVLQKLINGLGIPILYRFEL